MASKKQPLSGKGTGRGAPAGKLRLAKGPFAWQDAFFIAMHHALSRIGSRIEEPPIAWLMNLALREPGLISLAAGFTDAATLPVTDTCAAAASILGGETGRPALQYGATSGLPGLIRLTGERLALQDGRPDAPAYAPQRMLITHGSQQLLYLLVEALCDEGDIVLVEDPTYFVFLGILASRGVQVRGVRLDAEGMQPESLESVLRRLQAEQQLPRVKLVYAVTYFQNPTGWTTTLERKRRALELLGQFEPAAGHPLYYLEDAAYRDLRFGGDEVPSALSLPGAEERVLYAGTYSKPYATGIRVGFGVLPEPICTPVRRLQGNHDFGTSHLLQHLMLEVLQSGRFEPHLAALRRRYAAKASLMTAALREFFPAGVGWDDPAGGLYVWARLPQGISAGTASPLFQEALRQKVIYVPGELCYADDPHRPRPAGEMRLSFGGAADEQIPEGIRRLGAVLRAFVPA